MTEPTPDTPAPAKAQPKAKGVTVTAPEQDWAEPARSETGHQLASDGFPITGVARAIALAEAGQSTDQLGIVSDEAIAAHDPKAAAADRAAVERYHAEQAEKAAAERAAAVEASQQEGS